MRVNNQPEWHELARDLQSDPEQGEPFLDFIVQWCDRAEENTEGMKLSPMDCLRRSLAATEDSLGSRKSIWVLGQALAVICMHWFYGGEAFTADLTEIELRLVQDIVGIKIAELQTQAQVGE